MENNYVLSSNGDLYHWGVKGMRWGVRRYQNKDGSLTAAGQKRRAKLQSKIDKIDGNTTAKNSGKTIKKISDMTDDELRDYISRKTSEKQAYGLERDISQLNPKKVSAGEKFISGLRDKVLGPAAMEAGKKFMSGIMDQAVKKALGNDGSDELSKLKKQAEKAGYQQTMANARKAAAEAIKAEKEANKKDVDDPELSERERAAKMADYEKREHEARNAKAKADWQEQVAKDAKAKSEREEREREAKRSSDTTSRESSYTTSRESSGTTSASVYNRFSDTHGDESWSSFTRDTSDKRKTGKDYIDAEWYEVKDDD